MKSKTFDAMCDAAALRTERSVDNNGFITEAEISEFVNHGIEEVWDMMTQAVGLEYFLKEATVSVVSGTSKYDLAADFYQLLNCWYSTGSDAVMLEKWAITDEPVLRNLYQEDGNIRYRVIGSDDVAVATDRIELLPVPKKNFTLNYDYIPQPPALTYGSGDVFVGHPAAIEYAEIIAAIKIHTKEGVDISPLVADSQRIAKRLLAMASAKDRMRPAQIRDTRRDRSRIRWY